jgi:hypothetical protein
MKAGYKGKDKYLVWHIEGGLGKNIAATALISSIKEKYSDRKLIMVASYPEVFINFEEIERVYPVGNTPYFYQNYIEDKDTLVFKQEGYFQNGHISKQQHIIESWCQILDLEYKNQKPVIRFNLVQRRVPNIWRQDKPIMVIQTNGGPLEDTKPYSWTRDMPPYIALQIINHYLPNYHIYQVCRNESQVIPGAVGIFDKITNTELISLLAVSEKRVLIDSCLQHAAAGIGLKSTVLWVGTSPKLFGYDTHSNMVALPPKRKPKLYNSYLFDYSFDGSMDQCPYDDAEEMFNFKEIIATIDKT